MSRSDTAPPSRHFDDAQPLPAVAAPTRRRYPCLAHGCPMPGAIFLNGPDAPGICSLHYGLNSTDMARVSDVLRNWECVTFALENARRLLTDPAHCGDVKAEQTLLDAQWTQLQACAPDWNQLRPHGQTLGEWARQLLAFLVWRVNCDAHGRKSQWQWPPMPSRTVRDMFTRVRGIRLPDIDETPLSDAEVAIAQRDIPWLLEVEDAAETWP